MLTVADALFATNKGATDFVATVATLLLERGVPTTAYRAPTAEAVRTVIDSDKNQPVLNYAEPAKRQER